MSHTMRAWRSLKSAVIAQAAAEFVLCAGHFSVVLLSLSDVSCCVMTAGQPDG
jgi:hypothetical protein